MKMTKKIDEVDNKLKKTEQKIDELEEQSLAMELLKYSKYQNLQLNAHVKRLFILLIIVTSFWFLTMAGGYYYITHYTTEITEEMADAEDGGNACVGDNCNNGEINYGESKKNN